MQKFDFSYDRENDDLFMFDPGSKSRGSVEMGNIVLDYNSRKEVVGIQMIKASSLIKDMVDARNACHVGEVLKNLKECKVDVSSKNNLLIIKIHLSGKTCEILPIISVPSIRESSPALAYA